MIEFKWTWDEPTVPGWYFVRDFKWITDKSYSLQARVVWIGRNMIEDNLIKRECAWAGPIPEPIEADDIDDDVEREDATDRTEENGWVRCEMCQRWNDWPSSADDEDIAVCNCHGEI